MNNIIPKLLILLVALNLGCSLDVKKANVETNPPTIDKVNFNISDITGSFSRFEGTKYKAGVAPKVFLWPNKKIDDNGDFQPMSFAEQVKAREVITAAADELAIFEKDLEDAEAQIEAKYGKLKTTYDVWWKDNSCYQMCSDDAFFCDPSDKENTEIDEDDWKVITCEEQEEALKTCQNPPAPEEEEAEEGEAETADATPDCSKEELAVQSCMEEKTLLVSCQSNQEDRNALDKNKASEKTEILDPLIEKTSKAGNELLQAVGDENYFGDFKFFQFTYGNYDCVAGETVEDRGDCSLRNDKGGSLVPYINVVYGDFHISNYSKNKSKYQITDIQLDKVDGYLTFKMPVVDFENDNKIIGEMVFDLEFVKDGERMKMDGDIRYTSKATGVEEIGRFASAGQMKENPAQQ